MKPVQASRLLLQDVRRRFGAVTALDGLSLEVAPGRITSLLGPSGCGKTTALRIIAGFLSADSGDVLVDGRSQLALPPHRRDSAMVFQDFALFPHMNVTANIAYGLKQRAVARAELNSRVAAMLEFLQLSGMGSRMPHELSGGQQQRVALGRALVVRPRVLLMDEPLSNLDARLRSRVRSELRQIQRELHLTTVFVTHDQEEALSLSDSIAVMNAGRVEQAGTPRELFERPVNRFVADVLGEANFLPVSAAAGAGSVLVLGQRLLLRPGSTAATGPQLLLVRPDWLRPGPGEAGGLELKARLLSRDYHGSFERCWLQVQQLEQPLQMDVPAGVAAGTLPEPGSELTVSLQPGRAVTVAEND